MDGDKNTGELPFPAAALRTSYHAPDFDLVNQDGERVALEALRGELKKRDALN